MKVVGLISGGKDSIYNLQLCQDQGHEVVALANLFPEDSEVDELDSFMYQTVGHQLVESYAACTNLPLFRQPICGTPKQADLAYSQLDGDEVEDLFTLLAYVKHCIPVLQAVSSGAIASTYQRTRVEHVASRLGLVSLSFLWMQPQRALFQGMIDSGINAILVKVAALGLDPQKHLGKTLQQMQPTLHKLARQFGCNVCGEGGEYETLTLDCRLFTQARIVLKNWSLQLHSPGDVASVGVLHPLEFALEPKPNAGVLGEPSKEKERTQNALLNEKAAANGVTSRDACTTLAGKIILVPNDFQAREAPASTEDVTPEATEQLHTNYVQCKGFLSVHAWFGGPRQSSAQAGFEEEAFCAVLAKVEKELKDRFNVSLKDAVLTQINLADMAHFAAMNGVYKRFFPLSRPAARACVQFPLQVGQQFTIQLLIHLEEQLAASASGREVLHVQSISHWAPSCIGPYSQAVKSHGLLFLAGQIGLDPPTMQLLPTLDAQIQQSFSSCQAIATAMQVNLHANVLHWKLYSSQNGSFRAAAAMHNRLQNFSEPSHDGGSEDDDIQDSYLRVPPGEQAWLPVTTYISIPALPRGAEVEVQPLLCFPSNENDTASESSSSSSNSNYSEDETRRKGWTGQLQRSHCSDLPSRHGQISVEALSSSGRFLCCTVSVADIDIEGRVPTACEGTLQAGLQDLMNQFSEAAGTALIAAELKSADVFSIHLYYRADLCGDGASTTSIMTEMSKHVRGQALADAAPVSCLPVLAVGSTPDMKALILLELLAYDRAG